MGWHSKAGTATKAPEVFFNHAGCPRWAGKKARDLSPDERDDLLEFTRDFAYAKGRGDGIRNAQRPAWNLFHPDFLDGEPYSLFAEALERGYQAGLAERTENGLDALEAQEERMREQQQRADAVKWDEEVARRLLWSLPTDSTVCEALGCGPLERFVLSVIAKRAIHRHVFATPSVCARMWHSLRRRLSRVIRVHPQMTYLPGRLATTFMRRHRTTYDLVAEFNAYWLHTRAPRFSERLFGLSRLQALALTWYLSTQGAFGVRVSGFLHVPQWPYSGINTPIAVERLGWQWANTGSQNLYLGWPRLYR